MWAVIILAVNGISNNNKTFGSYKQTIEKLRDQKLEFESTDIFDNYIYGDMKNYMTMNHINKLEKMLLSEFSDILITVNIGQTYQGQDMNVFVLSKQSKSGDDKISHVAKRGVFVNGAHHARELTAVQMNFYILLKLIYNYELGDSFTHKLLEDCEIYILPIVNLDGYQYISDVFQSTNQLSYIRKNRNDGTKDGSNACKKVSSSDQVGVDLNRNYGYMWGLTDRGSSGDPCEEDYRGPAPFSEPETQNIKKFLESKKDVIKFAFNMHAWGNLLIHAFNYEDQHNSKLVNSFPQAAIIYNEVYHNTEIPKGMITGNGMQTIGYDANGEASDWMLGELGIISFSPELGTASKKADKFFISEKKVIQGVLQQNQKWIINTMKLLHAKIEVEVLNATYRLNQNGELEQQHDVDIDLNVRVKNNGLRRLEKDSQITIKLNKELVKGIVAIHSDIIDLEAQNLGEEQMLVSYLKVPQLDETSSQDFTVSLKLNLHRLLNDSELGNLEQSQYIPEVNNETENTTTQQNQPLLSLLSLEYQSQDFDENLTQKLLQTKDLKPNDQSLLTKNPQEEEQQQQIITSDDNKPQNPDTTKIAVIVIITLLVLLAGTTYSVYFLYMKYKDRRDQSLKFIKQMQSNSDTFVYESNHNAHLPKGNIQNNKVGSNDFENYENLDDLQYSEENINTTYSV
eukprot:403356572